GSGEQIGCVRGEGDRPENTEDWIGRRPAALDAGVTITAGNASQISDGAAALVIMSAAAARARGVRTLAEIVAHGMSAEQFAWLHTVPALALSRALEKAGLGTADLDLVEINEAFAAVALNAAR